MTGRPPRAGRLARTVRATELRELMRSWRERLDPAAIPKVLGRAGRQVTQELIARMIGVSPQWYGRLERGNIGRSYSPEFLDQVADALRLAADERNVLYHLALGHPPAPNSRYFTDTVSTPTQAVVHALPYPAWICDPAWNVIVVNEEATRYFSELGVESNIARWVFSSPVARYQLVDWETTWAPLTLAQLRAARARWPDNDQLNGLIEEILKVSDFANQRWRTHPQVRVPHDGDRRRLLPGGRAPALWVEVVTFTLMPADDLRLIVLVPRDHDAQNTAMADAVGRRATG